MTSRSEKFKNLFSQEEILKMMKIKVGPGVKVKNHVIKALSETPMGFMGEHLIMTVTEESDKEHSFFVKVTITDNPAHAKMSEEMRVFYKEVELYNKLLLDYEEAQPETDTNWRPTFYHSRDDEVVVLGDLNIEGYKMYPERKVLDEDHIRKTIESIVKMHAGSFVFEDKFNKGLMKTRSVHYKPNPAVKFAQICDIYPDLIFENELVDIPGHPGTRYCETAFKSELSLLEYLEGYTIGEMKIIREKVPVVMREIYEWVKPSTKYKNIMLHGDLWSNNILFRYDEKGRVEHAKIIDFQTVRYATPASELMMFLHVTQKEKFREEKKDELLKYYHDLLTAELNKYNLDIDTLLPWSVFKESCDFYHRYGCICAVFFFQVILLAPHIVEKLLSSNEVFDQNIFVDRSELIRESVLEGGENRDRMLEALQELIKCHVLK